MTKKAPEKSLCRPLSSYEQKPLHSVPSIVINSAQTAKTRRRKVEPCRGEETPLTGREMRNVHSLKTKSLFTLSLQLSQSQTAACLPRDFSNYCHPRQRHSMYNEALYMYDASPHSPLPAYPIGTDFIGITPMVEGYTSSVRNLAATNTAILTTNSNATPLTHPNTFAFTHGSGRVYEIRRGQLLHTYREVEV